MPSFLYSVQDDQGREIVAAHVDVDDPDDVRAIYEPGNVVSLVFEDLLIERALHNGDGPLALLRWPSDAKLSEPVKHPVK